MNDLIKNNIFQTKSNRDGNLTVIRSMAVFSRGFGAFQYSSATKCFMMIYIVGNHAETLISSFQKTGSSLLEKQSIKAFFAEKSKSLIALVETAKLIFPDKVVLARNVDDNGWLEKAKASLHHLFNKWAYEPQIETLKLQTPDYWHIKSHRYFKY